MFDQAGTSANAEYCKDTSPVKSSFSADGAKGSTSKQKTSKSHVISKDDAKDSGTSSSESDDYRRRKRKRKSKKIKKRKRHRSSSSSSSSDNKDELHAARVSSNSFAVPHYYNLHGYPIPFNAGHSGNIQSVALNASHMYFMRFQKYTVSEFREYVLSANSISCSPLTSHSQFSSG